MKDPRTRYGITKALAATAIFGLAATATAFAETGTPDAEELIRTQFESMDRNDSGTIERQDVQSGTALYKHFDRYDASNTGSLDFDEFRAYVHERRAAQERGES